MTDCELWLTALVLTLRVTLEVVDMVKARRGNDGPSQSPEL